MDLKMVDSISARPGAAGGGIGRRQFFGDRSHRSPSNSGPLSAIVGALGNGERKSRASR
jgi:hypothetical protein